MATLDFEKPRAIRGFAAMTLERRLEIARKGGASVPSEKRSFARNRDLAVTAGRKGGEISRGVGRKRLRES
jgi:uncharacterized protein